MKLDKKSALVRAAILLAIGTAFGCGNKPAVAASVTFKEVDKALAAKEGIAASGKVVRLLQISDQAGEHLLLLTEASGPSRTRPGASDERTDLSAGFYSRSATKWVREWVINDGVDCPGLDHTAQFFSEHVTVTDLDKNGMAEVTVPYKIFCGGGVDVATLKVIMRQGDQKFAMRGTTKIVIPGEQPFGGDATYDKALSERSNAPFRQHIAGVRAKVVTHKY